MRNCILRRSDFPLHTVYSVMLSKTHSSIPALSFGNNPDLTCFSLIGYTAGRLLNAVHGLQALVLYCLGVSHHVGARCVLLFRLFLDLNIQNQWQTK